MMIPIRCLSCGRPVGHVWSEFKERVANGEERKKVLDDLGLERYCCRTVFLGQTDSIELISKFKKS